MFAAAGDGDWDLLADDIVFCSEMRQETAFDRLLPEGTATPFDLDLAGFVQGNLPYANRHRRELGFLKPVIRRDTTLRLGVRYDERLRLGEDVLFYVNFLTAGARFRVVEACGYYAVQHPDSLSARHRTADIAALYEALEETRRRDPAAAGLHPYIRSTRNNLAVREALDRKRASGWAGFLTSLRDRPDCVPHVLKTVVRDKLAAVT
jgi:succinoglycan biosynthesis protein ExoU